MKKLICVLSFFILSINIGYGQYKQLKKCINKNALKFLIDESYYEIDTLEKFDLFDSIKSFESLLLKTRLLNSKNKIDYKNLIKRNLSIEDIIVVVDKIKLNHPIYYDFTDESLNAIMMYSNCPEEIMSKSQQIRSCFMPVRKTYDKLIKEGFYPNARILMRLAQKTDFKNDVSRLMLTHLFNVYLLTEYRSELFKSNTLNKK